MPLVPEPLTFAQAGRVPLNGDNAAIALRELPAGTRILIRQLVFEFTHTVLEGHRFALYRIRKGEPLLSWGLPFGLATRDIEPGEYLCNEKILGALAERHVRFALPAAPNFSDYRLEFALDETRFRPAEQVTRAAPVPVFQGFPREQRGAGTRNYIVLVGVSSRAGPLCRAVAARFANVTREFPNIDGVVAVEHTEGGSANRPHNQELTLRTLAGFVTHPNAGAVLCLDVANEASVGALQQFLAANKYPAGGLIHEFTGWRGSWTKSLEAAANRIREWLPRVNAFQRRTIPASELRLGLQCGGSDAFSGISANPLLGILAREIVAAGGSANLAETDELIGAEQYVLEKVRDLETARAFLRRVERFQQWAALHGHSAEGNPSGGNMYRGLYNITIKSIGAARKKDPAARLDQVIDFAEPMRARGFYFMDSPGNDLESIAGQVAAGCNLILFATGNGSITNFPFVPAIKIMTTTARFELVRNEMDFNAGRFLDGEEIETLGREAFEQMIAIASGRRSAGERAAHSQVQLWREWREGAVHGGRDRKRLPLPTESGIDAWRADAALAPHPLERLALVLPTSLCSGQIAEMIATELNGAPHAGFTRAVALPHTEGCGNSGGEPERLFMRTMAGYLAHPFVSKALLLEHGCEKTHNDAFRNLLRELDLPEANFGFASVQMDGGIERVTRKVVQWFNQNPASRGREPGATTIGFVELNAPDNLRSAFLLIAAAIAVRRATALLAEGLAAGLETVGYGEAPHRSGAFEMSCPTEDLSEIITGLAAAGAELIVAFDDRAPIPANPIAATIQVSANEQWREDSDLVISSGQTPREIANNLLEIIAQVRSGKRVPRGRALGNTAFQVTRGLTGISL